MPLAFGVHPELVHKRPRSPMALFQQVFLMLNLLLQPLLPLPPF